MKKNTSRMTAKQIARLEKQERFEVAGQSFALFLEDMAAEGLYAPEQD